jgi:hypothetical protein
MTVLAQPVHPPLVSRKSNHSNTLGALGLRGFASHSNLTNNFHTERIFRHAPHWHKACNPPLQWKEARNFAGVAICLATRFTGVPRCFSSRHSWAAADW